VSVQRVLRDTRAQPKVTFYVGTTPTDADAAVTVDIFRADGSIFATDAPTTGPSPTGTYTYTLAPQSVLERFQLVWEGTFGGVVQRQTSYVEVVGGYVVSLADLQAESGLSTKTPAQLAEARQWFEDLAEQYCGVAFVPRYAREVRDGDGTNELELRHPYPQTVLSCKVGGVAQTGLTTWDLYPEGLVARDTGAFSVGRRNVEIIYEHGLDTVPSDVREAALTAIRSNVLSATAGGGIPAGVTQLITDAGTYNFGRPTSPFGIRDVDLVLAARKIIPVG
jgi:hypothetical protein